MRGWSNPASSWALAANRSRTSGSAASAGGSSLIATARPRSRCRACVTMPHGLHASSGPMSYPGSTSSRLGDVMLAGTVGRNSWAAAYVWSLGAAEWTDLVIESSDDPVERLLVKLAAFVADLDDEERSGLASLLAPGVAIVYEVAVEVDGLVLVARVMC